MSCSKCPHCVRHGTPVGKSQKIEFQDVCGLKIKAQQNQILDIQIAKSKSRKKAKPKEYDLEKKQILYSQSKCPKSPFTDDFNYKTCEVLCEYLKTPTKDVVSIRSPHLIDQLGKSVFELDFL
jgi:hypothetical protein